MIFNRPIDVTDDTWIAAEEWIELNANQIVAYGLNKVRETRQNGKHIYLYDSS